MNEAADLITPEARRTLLTLALGSDHIRRTEHRFRHAATGKAKTTLDLRTDDPAEWVSQWRTVIETDWTERQPYTC